MKATDNGYLFESTNREILSYNAEGFSLSDDNIVRIGYDSMPEFWDSTLQEYDQDFKDEERKELALYMIDKWAKFGGIEKPTTL